MRNIRKKIVLDEYGNPAEVIIPYKEFLEIEEIIGLDLEEEVEEQLLRAQKDRALNKKDAYVDLDEI